MFTTVIAIAVIYYGIYKLIRPKGKPTSAKQYGQLWAAWVSPGASLPSLSRFLRHLDVDTFGVWLISIISVGGISFFFGYIYGKIKIKIKVKVKNNAVDATNQKIEIETSQSDTTKKLAELKNLFENNLISQEDYDKKKEQILNDI